MRARTWAASLATAILLSGPALAAVDSAPEPARLALAQRYADAQRLSEQIQAGEPAYVEATLNQRAQDGPMDPDMRRIEATILRGLLTEDRQRKVADRIQLYATRFTLEELRAMVAFAESPAGRSIALKSAEVQAEVTRHEYGRLPAFRAAFADRVRKHLETCAAHGPGSLRACANQLDTLSALEAPPGP